MSIKNNDNRPKVGVAVLLIKDAKILLGKRLSDHGYGTWAPPGGHLEFKESFEDCAKREVLEETGLELLDVHMHAVTNDIFNQDDKHYVSIFMLSDKFIGEPKVLEVNKCQEWKWFELDQLPKELFKPLENLIAQESQGN